MYIFYIDESGLENESQYVFLSAIGLNRSYWKSYFSFLKTFRDQATKDYGFYKYKEWHATKFVGGRGKLGKSDIHKSIRLKVFNQLLEELSQQNYLTIINVKCMKRHTGSLRFAINCLLNRLKKFLKHKNKQAILIIDNGHNSEYRREFRKLHVINPLPSRKGNWGDGKKYNNFPLKQFIENPLFVDSKESLLIQVVDFIVYSLNRYFMANSKQRGFNLHESFLKLDSILCKEASKSNSLGIVEL